MNKIKSICLVVILVCVSITLFGCAKLKYDFFDKTYYATNDTCSHATLNHDSICIRNKRKPYIEKVVQNGTRRKYYYVSHTESEIVWRDRQVTEVQIMFSATYKYIDPSWNGKIITKNESEHLYYIKELDIFVEGDCYLVSNYANAIY